ncbi:hypothetical protein [Streptosporangium sp. 'caverna']|uniref:hypothetical protein n=1 Tax=Streptosporangium sp. 'caverna' TaxID=2202249 RepID=UPI000D7E5C31|nr:hypothetical protein [Streptosporangium sp. 'caverna']AWS43640.1 hypothetical protein DKM19_21995 [Streptosporangium sp. 'caverna']
MTSRYRPAPVAQQQAAAVAAPRLPSTVDEWKKQLAQLIRELEPGGQFAHQHWQHGRLYGALLDVIVALGNAYPGGIDRLQPRH